VILCLINFAYSYNYGGIKQKKQANNQNPSNKTAAFTKPKTKLSELFEALLRSIG